MKKKNADSFAARERVYRRKQTGGLKQNTCSVSRCTAEESRWLDTLAEGRIGKGDGEGRETSEKRAFSSRTEELKSVGVCTPECFPAIVGGRCIPVKSFVKS